SRDTVCLKVWIAARDLLECQVLGRSIRQHGDLPGDDHHDGTTIRRVRRHGVREFLSDPVEEHTIALVALARGIHETARIIDVGSLEVPERTGPVAVTLRSDWRERNGIGEYRRQ